MADNNPERLGNIQSQIAIQPSVVEPVHIPVHFIDAIVNSIIVGSTISVTLATNRVGRDDRGQAKDEFMIAARLRFDLGTAKLVRDRLSEHINLLSPPPAGKAN